MYTALNQYHVVMEVDPQFQQSPDVAAATSTCSRRTGSEVPLSAFAHFEHDQHDARGEPPGPVPGDHAVVQPGPGVALGDAVDAIEQAEREIGMPANVHGSFTGTAQAFQASLANEPHPDPGGAGHGLHRARHAVRELHPPDHDSLDAALGRRRRAAGAAADARGLSVIALIGIILLIGIVKKNAIMMIDFALEAERTRGQELARRDLRGVPAALPPDHDDHDGGDARRRAAGARRRRRLGTAPAAGITIVGGLIVSQMLTLYTTPVIYLYLDRLRLWFERVRPRRRSPGLSPATYRG